MKIKLRKHRYLLFYLYLSIAIMLLLFRPGYILTLDMAFGPNPDLIARLYGLNEWWVPMLGAHGIIDGSSEEEVNPRQSGPCTSCTIVHFV